MKKIIASAVGLMIAGGMVATNASAVENVFGGYWRTRAAYMDNFDQANPDNFQNVDTRTRLYYTAKFSDDLKLVNKFEFNTGWGDKNGGDIGADGKGNWRIKNSYADFNMGAVNANVGIQSRTIARGFLFADDFSGVALTGNFGNVKVPLIWINAANKDAASWDGAAVPDYDMNYLIAMATVNVNDNMSVTPYFMYDDKGSTDTVEDSSNFYLGVDADMKFDAVSAWFTGIFNGGDYEGDDNAGFLVAAGVDAGIVHGQAFYATGDDDPTDGDNDAFIAPPGSSYYWSEILGYGIFDNYVPGGPDDNITNAWAANAGVTVKPMDKLTLTFDAWYAALVEDNANGDTELGTELDGKLTYQVLDNLKADFVFAYLIAGDALGDEDVTEAGIQLSLSF